MTALVSLPRTDFIGPAQDDDPAVPCQGDPAMFFPDTNTKLAQAKAVCAPCPERIGCLAGALTRREGWGVWGGTFFYAGRLAVKVPLRGQLSHHQYADQPQQ